MWIRKGNAICNTDMYAIIWFDGDEVRLDGPEYTAIHHFKFQDEKAAETAFKIICESMQHECMFVEL